MSKTMTDEQYQAAAEKIADDISDLLYANLGNDERVRDLMHLLASHAGTAAYWVDEDRYRSMWGISQVAEAGYQHECDVADEIAQEDAAAEAALAGNPGAAGLQ